MRKIKVLSLFDGISVARQALKMAGFRPAQVEYYASEVDQAAEWISKRNWPDIIRLGDVRKITRHHHTYLFDGSVDLLIGGSPCQDLSSANSKQVKKGLAGDRSGLFFEYVRIMDEARPRNFVLENVTSMSLSSCEAISAAVGTYPVVIDAALVSAQRRKRYFWANFKINQPAAEDHDLKNILIDGFSPSRKSYCIRVMGGVGICGEPPHTTRAAVIAKISRLDFLIRGLNEWVYALPISRKLPRSAVYDWIRSNYTEDSNLLGWQRPKPPAFRGWDGKPYRHFNRTELERLQSLPDGYTGVLPNFIKGIGNAFNARVIQHIISQMMIGQPAARISRLF